MSGRWEDSNRRAQLPRDWARRRRMVIERADGQCERLLDGVRCTNAGRDVDHKRRGNDHSLANLQLLCSECHTRKTQREAAEARRAVARRLRYPTERHPGLNP